MTLLRFGSLVGALALIVVLSHGNPAEAQVRVQIQPVQSQPFQLQPVRFATGPLVPDNVQEKLNLTREQKEKIEKVQKEFTDKTSNAEAKIKEAREKALQDKDREALAKVREMSQEVQKTRSEFVEKVKEVLTAEQKKTYEAALQPMRRPDLQVNPRNARPDLTSKTTQDRLNLTAEQKEKLEKLQKDFEAKTLEVLTKEQKERFEELKKQPRTTPRPLIRPNPNP